MGPLNRVNILVFSMALAMALPLMAEARRPTKHLAYSRGDRRTKKAVRRQPRKTTRPKSYKTERSAKPKKKKSVKKSQPRASYPSTSQPSVSQPRTSQPRTSQPRASQPRNSSRRTARPTYKAPGRTTGGPASASMFRNTPKPPTVLKRGGQTYNQRIVKRGNQTFMRRTPAKRTQSPHVSHHHDHHPPHHHHDCYYHPHHYHHHHYWVYVHYWAYDPWFWGFYFAPFPAPWHYTWVWVGAPWYATWGWYWAPYPYYVGPSYWVTDYTMARMLADEYERGYVDGQVAAGTPISEPVKEQVRIQVDETAKAFQADQSITLDQALGDPSYLFIVDAPITAATTDGQTCSLSGGDIIKAAGENDPQVPVASMSVVTSKHGSCEAGKTVNVSYTDLQEMLNTFSATVDDGLNELQNEKAPEQSAE